MRSLDNQRVLVIGGSSGIGLAIAAATSDTGASVTTASRNKERLTTVNYAGEQPTSKKNTREDLSNAHSTCEFPPARRPSK